jgi:hypothetical protein
MEGRYHWALHRDETVIHAPALLVSERDCYKRGGVLVRSELDGLVGMRQEARPHTTTGKISNNEYDLHESPYLDKPMVRLGSTLRTRRAAKCNRCAQDMAGIFRPSHSECAASNSDLVEPIPATGG